MGITLIPHLWLLGARIAQAVCGVVVAGLAGSRMSFLQGFSGVNVNVNCF